MTKQHGVPILPSASSIFGKGFFRTQRKVRSSTAASSFCDGLDHQAHRIARRPAVDARHRVFGQNRLAVVELEPRPQPERPGEAVRRHLLGFDHLALRPQLVVHAVKHVPHHAPSVAHDIGWSSRSDRNWRDRPAARNAACAPRRVARSPGWRGPPVAARAPAPAAVFRNVRRSMMFAPRIRSIDFDAIKYSRHKAPRPDDDHEWWCKTKRRGSLEACARRRHCRCPFTRRRYRHPAFQEQLPRTIRQT